MRNALIYVFKAKLRNYLEYEYVNILHITLI